MGERLSGHGIPGRRRAQPDDAGPGVVQDHAGLEALIASAMRRDTGDAGAERRAVAAFREARESGAHRTRTRRRDDWRPERQGTRRTVRAGLSVLAASLTLGGVAYAAIGGPYGAGADDPGGRPGTSSTERPGTASPAASPAASGAGVGAGVEDGGGTPEPPDSAQDSAQDIEARCRAYAQVKDPARAADAKAWQQLVAAAGGADEVDAYCARQTAQPSETPSAARGNSDRAASHLPTAGASLPPAATNAPTEAGTGIGAGNADGTPDPRPSGTGKRP
ncbi:hypothetical protein ACL02U_10465 [Streptomyces sp. MS06]|uniref:hypothetical protein n=1 Tax=Streptomyces sp. MS06 TaxID=3385974 RepID=UPI0039A0F659